MSSSTPLLLTPALAQGQTQQQEGGEGEATEVGGEGGEGVIDESANYIPESLFIALLAAGDALVEYDVSIIDPLQDARISLFAREDVSNLIVVDYDDNLIEYDVGDTPDQIVLSSPGVSNIRISYSTEDLLNKFRREWTFSLDASVGFSLKLPPDSIFIDATGGPFSITVLGKQSLLTFNDPGNVTVSYVIGTLGTEERANIVIKAAETAIKEIEGQYQGIILAGAKGLLQQAVAARDEAKFADAETLAVEANDAATAAGRDFEVAQKAIEDAEEEIRKAAAEGRDTSAAGALLERAKSEFSKGDYAMALDSAEDVAGAIVDRPDPPELPVAAIAVVAVAAAGGVGAMLVLRKRQQPRVAVPQQHQQQQQQKQQLQRRNAATAAQDASHESVSPPGMPPDVPSSTQPAEPGRPSSSPITPQSMPEDASAVRKPDSQAAAKAPSAVPLPPPQPPSLPGTLPDSQTEPGLLSRIVGRIIEERPHLRPEDQQVLVFLAEKEGAAFESEVRSKFQLPKTTIWRLVKRLEREELVEIRKAGGQNLIKLRFEGRQP